MKCGVQQMMSYECCDETLFGDISCGSRDLNYEFTGPVSKTRHSITGSSDNSATPLQITRTPENSSWMFGSRWKRRRTDTEGDIISDASIIVAVINNEKMPENDDVNVEDTMQTPRISHNRRLKDVETSLQYFEQRGASVIGLMFLPRLRDEASKQSSVRKTLALETIHATNSYPELRDEKSVLSI
ncbi:hypothetical protein TNCV_3527061 [Trichonephila clavipes]|nr:hypothetical protein TNCV_3527061 [Trichonephila clavipes]